MCTLTKHDHASPVTLADHPLARVLAAVRERIKARGLGFKAGDECLKAAREHFIDGHSVASSVAVGQRMADQRRVV